MSKSQGFTLKRNIADLAFFSAEPAFHEKLHVGRPNIGDRNRFLKRLNDILDRRWLSNAGRYVEELERKISEFTSVKHCVAMCNGTIALEIASRALGLKGEVIVPSFTFVATAHSLQWQEITPVFCDIDRRTHNIDPGCVEKMITPKTTGIVGVHIWGRPCDIEALQFIAKRHSLKLMFDSAHAFGCTYKGKMVGNFGDAEVFSFHATKLFNAFEGGAVLTNNRDLASKMRLMKNFGFEGYDNVIHVGTNGKMSEASAAMALTNLESFEDFLAINQRNYECYQRYLQGIPGISLIQYSDLEKHNYQYIVLEIEECITKISRNQLQRILWEENVLARRYFYPGCHRMEPYKSFFPHAGLLLPETEKISDRVLTLPTGTGVSQAQIEVICSIIRLSVEHADEVLDKMGTLSNGV